MDCKRADDEDECPVQCEVGQFACPLHKNMSNAHICVNQKHICDGQLNCPNGEDEKNCPKRENVKRAHNVSNCASHRVPAQMNAPAALATFCTTINASK